MRKVNVSAYNGRTVVSLPYSSASPHDLQIPLRHPDLTAASPSPATRPRVLESSPARFRIFRSRPWSMEVALDGSGWYAMDHGRWEGAGTGAGAERESMRSLF